MSGRDAGRDIDNDPVLDAAESVDDAIVELEHVAGDDPRIDEVERLKDELIEIRDRLFDLTEREVY